MGGDNLGMPPRQQPKKERERDGGSSFQSKNFCLSLFPSRDCRIRPDISWQQQEEGPLAIVFSPVSRCDIFTASLLLLLLEGGLLLLRRRRRRSLRCGQVRWSLLGPRRVYKEIRGYTLTSDIANGQEERRRRHRRFRSGSCFEETRALCVCA